MRRNLLLALRFFSFTRVNALLLEVTTDALLAIAYVVTIRKVEGGKWESWKLKVSRELCAKGTRVYG